MKEKKRTGQIRNEHSKRVMQARYQQTALVRLKLLDHTKAELIIITTNLPIPPGKYKPWVHKIKAIFSKLLGNLVHMQLEVRDHFDLIKQG